jgi:hypothetical protein
MKYVIRRAVVSIALSPAIAGAYVLGYAMLVGLGAEPTTDVAGAWSNGWLIAFVSSIGFIFWEKIDALVNGKN